MRFAEPAGYFDSFGASLMASTKHDQSYSYEPDDCDMTLPNNESQLGRRRLPSCSSSLSLRSFYQTEEEMTLLFESCWRQIGLPDFVTLSQMLDLLSILEELVRSPFFFTLDDDIVGHLKSICKPLLIYMKPEAFKILTIILDDIRVFDYETQTFYGKPQPVDRLNNTIEYYVDQNYHIVEASEIAEEATRCSLKDSLSIPFSGYDDTDKFEENEFAYPSRQRLSPSPSFSLDAESIMEYSGFVKGHVRTVSSPITEASFEPLLAVPSKPSLLKTSSRASLQRTDSLISPKALLVAELMDRLLDDYQFVNLKYSCVEYEINVHRAHLLHQDNDLLHLSKSTTSLELRVARLRSAIDKLKLKPVEAAVQPTTELIPFSMREADESTTIPVVFWLALIVVIFGMFMVDL